MMWGLPVDLHSVFKGSNNEPPIALRLKFHVGAKHLFAYSLTSIAKTGRKLQRAGELSSSARCVISLTVQSVSADGTATLEASVLRQIWLLNGRPIDPKFKPGRRKNIVTMTRLGNVRGVQLPSVVTLPGMDPSVEQLQFCSPFPKGWVTVGSSWKARFVGSAFKEAALDCTLERLVHRNGSTIATIHGRGVLDIVDVLARTMPRGPGKSAGLANVDVIYEFDSGLGLLRKMRCQIHYAMDNRLIEPVTGYEILMRSTGAQSMSLSLIR